MTTISIVTPWLNGAVGPNELLTDYLRATEGADQLVFVDNGSDQANADALSEALAGDMEHRARGVYIRNETNAGFAGANNQGYADATGDIVIFLNSDIAGDPAWLRAVVADVKAGALYGPALQQQLVHGDLWPYLEGWCVAATRAMWDALTYELYTQSADQSRHQLGPWDDFYFVGPYWEDNDLCLRAAEAGIALVQTAWQLQHKGGRTAGPLLRHGASFEANRATFAARVAQHAEQKRTAPASPTYAAYLNYCNTQSDIQHHLPLLYAAARGNVVELGTRTGVSTAALLAGVEHHGGRVVSVDIDPQSAQVAAGHPLWTFVQASSTDLTTRAKITEPIDLLLIDTIHTYAHVAAEFAVWAGAMRPGGTVLVHDTETFPGVRVAVEEFCAKQQWPVTFVRPCNGMAVVEVPNA